MRRITRRSAINTLAGAVGLSAIPVAATAIVPDPIFALIDRFKTAVEARGVALSAVDAAPDCAVLKDAHHEATNQEWEAMWDMLDTAPTSIVGVAALLDQLAAKPYDRLDKYPGESTLIEMVLTGPYARDAICVFTDLASTLRAMGGVS